jgi:hypothetical protein
LLAEAVVGEEADLVFVVEGQEGVFGEVQALAGSQDVVVKRAGNVPQIGQGGVAICGDEKFARPCCR